MRVDGEAVVVVIRVLDSPIVNGMENLSLSNDKAKQTYGAVAYRWTKVYTRCCSPGRIRWELLQIFLLNCNFVRYIRCS